MIYEFLEHMRQRIESRTNFKAMILPSLPAVYSLNTAYIIIPSNMPIDFAISNDMFAKFKVDIYFVTSDCNADDVSTMSKNVMKSYSVVKKLVDDIYPRSERSYSDADLDANCDSISVSMKSWMTGGKIPISTCISTSWKAIIKE